MGQAKCGGQPEQAKVLVLSPNAGHPFAIAAIGNEQWITIVPFFETARLRPIQQPSRSLGVIDCIDPKIDRG